MNANEQAKETAPLWVREFGTDYAIPAEVLRPGVVDRSWHNDACPSFVIGESPDGESGIVLWVEHPTPELREMPGPRFALCGREAGDSDLMVSAETWEEMRPHFEAACRNAA